MVSLRAVLLIALAAGALAQLRQGEISSGFVERPRIEDTYNKLSLDSDGLDDSTKSLLVNLATKAEAPKRTSSMPRFRARKLRIQHKKMQYPSLAEEASSVDVIRLTSRILAEEAKTDVAVEYALKKKLNGKESKKATASTGPSFIDESVEDEFPDIGSIDGPEPTLRVHLPIHPTQHAPRHVAAHKPAPRVYHAPSMRFVEVRSQLQGPIQQKVNKFLSEVKNESPKVLKIVLMNLQKEVANAKGKDLEVLKKEIAALQTRLAAAMKKGRNATKNATKKGKKGKNATKAGKAKVGKAKAAKGGPTPITGKAPKKAAAKKLPRKAGGPKKANKTGGRKKGPAPKVGGVSKKLKAAAKKSTKIVPPPGSGLEQIGALLNDLAAKMKGGVKKLTDGELETLETTLRKLQPTLERRKRNRAKQGLKELDHLNALFAKERTKLESRVAASGVVAQSGSSCRGSTCQTFSVPIRTVSAGMVRPTAGGPARFVPVRRVDLNSASSLATTSYPPGYSYDGQHVAPELAAPQPVAETTVYNDPPQRVDADVGFQHVVPELAGNPAFGSVFVATNAADMPIRVVADVAPQSTLPEFADGRPGSSFDAQLALGDNGRVISTVNTVPKGSLHKVASDGWVQGGGVTTLRGHETPKREAGVSTLTRFADKREDDSAHRLVEALEHVHEALKSNTEPGFVEEHATSGPKTAPLLALPNRNRCNSPAGCSLPDVVATPAKEVINTDALVATPQYLSTPVVLSKDAYNVATKNGSYPTTSTETWDIVEEEVGPGKKNNFQQIQVTKNPTTVKPLNPPQIAAKVNIPAPNPVPDCTGASCAADATRVTGLPQYSQPNYVARSPAVAAPRFAESRASTAAKQEVTIKSMERELDEQKNMLAPLVGKKVSSPAPAAPAPAKKPSDSAVDAAIRKAELEAEAEMNADASDEEFASTVDDAIPSIADLHIPTV